MLQKATFFLAFSILLLSCQTSKVSLPAPEILPPLISAPAVEEEPLPQPDWTVSDVALDETGKVVVALSNSGKGPVPLRSGNLKIYVDAELKWSTSLDDIPDQAFLSPGGTSRYPTPVELEGSHEVRAMIETDKTTLEDKGRNNLMTKVLSFERAVRPPPPSPLSPPDLSPPEPEDTEEISFRPDVILTDLSLNAKRELTVRLFNRGNAPFLFAEGTIRVFVDNVLKGSYPLEGLVQGCSLSPGAEAAFAVSVTIVGRREVYAHLEFSHGHGTDEGSPEDRSLKKILESPPIGPDIVVKDLVLTEDLELSIVLSNSGERRLRAGTALRIRVLLNGRRVSEFDHLITEPLRPNFGSRYIVEPPYHISIGGSVRVKVTIWPKQAGDDIRPDNNTLEKDFLIFPFQIDAQASQEFPFFPPSLSAEGSFQDQNIRTEVRWDGGGAPLRLRLKREGNLKELAQVTGKSPLELRFSAGEEDSAGKAWRFLVTNLTEKKVQGHLIVQSP